MGGGGGSGGIFFKKKGGGGSNHLLRSNLYCKYTKSSQKGGGEGSGPPLDLPLLASTSVLAGARHSFLSLVPHRNYHTLKWDT